MKDESARDKAIENLVSDKLRGGMKTGNGCPDVEIVAAYFERTLAPKERVRWESHFDTCAQCQQRIAALVRMDEAGEASISKPVAKFSAPPKRSSVFRWAWAAPVLLVVLVAGLWYTGEFDTVMNRHGEHAVQAPNPSTPPKSPSQPSSAEAPPKEAAPADRVAALPAGTTQAPAVTGAAVAKDELKLPRTVPATSAESNKIATPQPAPPPPKTGLDADRRDQQVQTASAAPGAGANEDKIQSLPMSGRNAAELSTTGQIRGQAEAQGAGSGAVSGGPGGTVPNSLHDAPQSGATGEVQAKAENGPTPQAAAAPSRAGAAGTEAGRQSTIGGFTSANRLAGGLFKTKKQAYDDKAAAATETATLRGDVRDATGAVIPGATVIVMNTRTNVVRPLKTNDAGEYFAAELNPGVYTIQASAQGFETSLKKDVAILARAERLEDFALSPGSATEPVTVEAASEAIGTVAPEWRTGPRGLIQARIGQDDWQTKPSGVTVDLYAISFPSREIGWAVGQQGTVLRSANGGESWGRVTSPTGEDLIRVRATSSQSAEVTTRRGILFRTTDGAATWSRVDTAH